MTTLTELEFVRFLISDSLERLRVTSPDHLKNPHKNRKSNSRKITKFLDIHISINQRPVCAAFLVTIPSKQGSHSYQKSSLKPDESARLNPFKTGKSFLRDDCNCMGRLQDVSIPSKQGAHSYKKIKFEESKSSKSQSLQNREVIPTKIWNKSRGCYVSQSLQNREVIPTALAEEIGTTQGSQSLQNREVIPTFKTARSH